MITGVVSCPGPPLLLPGLTGCPVPEVEQLRAACLVAVTDLLATEPSRIVLIGSDFAFAGAPLSVAVGQALLFEASAELPVQSVVVGASAGAPECARLGRTVASTADRIGLLVLADGSARRTVKAPGYLDDRAVAFDAEVEAALADADPAALAALDVELAAQLLAAGRPAWQVLAAASGDRAWQGQLYYAEAPFGVFYPVAGWLPSD